VRDLQRGQAYGRPLLAYGDVSTLSLHATKLMHSVEGGAVMSTRHKIADKIRRLRNIGLGPGGCPQCRMRPGSPGMPNMEMKDLGHEPLPEYAALFERFGVPPRTMPTLTLDPCPPSVALVAARPYALVRYVPYNGPGSAPRWLYAPRTRKRVCVTWGVSMARRIGSTAVTPYEEAIRTLADEDVELVVVTNAAQLRDLGKLPPAVRVAESAPLHEVLPFCDAVVLHGGSGTFLTAIAAGIPQVFITPKFEAEVTGDRVAATGAAAHLPRRELERHPDRAHLVAKTVRAVLDGPAYRDAARRLREEAEQQPTPSALVPKLEELANR